MRFNKFAIAYYPSVGQTNRTYYINKVKILGYSEVNNRYYIMYDSGQRKWVNDEFLFESKELAKEHLKERALYIYNYSLEKIESL
jgi:hypothetical protein